MSLLVDVRTDREFSHGHIPGAHHIPLLDNEEHKIIGTLFKKEGFDAAFLKAIEIVGPKMGGYIRQISELSTKTEPLTLYCSRGGMRSHSMCWLFSQAGFHVDTFPGGYKQYRSDVATLFKSPLKLKVICGLTGTGKTEHLKSLKKNGEQILNLEEIARHRGSAFGQTEDTQPTQQQFENELYSLLSSYNLEETIWIEDESSLIGHCQIPKPLFEQIKKAPSFLLEIPHEKRIRNILQEYAPRNRKEMNQRIEQILQISKKLGLERTKCAVSAVQNGQFELAVSIILPYYDKTYRYNLSHRKRISR